VSGNAAPKLGNGLARNRRCRPTYPSAPHRPIVALRDRLLHPGNHGDSLFAFTRPNILQLGFFVNICAAASLLSSIAARSLRLLGTRENMCAAAIRAGALRLGDWRSKFATLVRTQSGGAA